MKNSEFLRKISAYITKFEIKYAKKHEFNEEVKQTQKPKKLKLDGTIQVRKTSENCAILKKLLTNSNLTRRA